MRVTVILLLIDSLGTIPKGLEKEGFYIKASIETIKTTTLFIGQNAEKSPEDLRRLAVTQTPMKDYQLTLVWKNFQGIIFIIIIVIIIYNNLFVY